MHEPRNYSGLTAGSHTFRVRATDIVGNIGTVASRTWTIDLTAPAGTNVQTTNSGTAGRTTNGDRITSP